MFENIIKILSKTPWWVYAVFAYLIYIGIKSTKKQIVSINKLAIVSIAFFIFSIKSLDSLWNTQNLVAYIWLFSILIGISIGYLSFINKKIIVDKRSKLVQVPGSYSVIFIVMFVFISRYILGFMAAINREFISQLYFIFLRIFFSSLPAGVLLGRLIFILKNFLAGPFGELKKTKSDDILKI